MDTLAASGNLPIAGCSAVAWNSLGYHASGTEMVRSEAEEVRRGLAAQEKGAVTVFPCTLVVEVSIIGRSRRPQVPIDYALA